MNTCTLIIKDEVNVKFEGLDPKTRRLCSAALKFKLPNAYYMRTVRLGRWDGSIAFFSMGGDTYLNLFPQIHDIIVKQGYDFIIKDQRIPNNIVLEPIDKNYLSESKWPEGHRFEGQPIILEEHQVNTINSLLDCKHGLVEAATGAGKTIITAALSKITQKYGRSIIIVPSEDLVEQTELDYKNIGLDVGVFFGKRKEFNKQHTVCTWQSLNRLSDKDKDPLSEDEITAFLKDVVMFLVDEAHLAAGDSIKKLLSGPFRNTPLRWGLTGTFPKDDHLVASIRGTIGEVVFRVPASELQEKGFLSNCHINIIQYEDDEEHESWADEDAYLTNNTELLGKTADFITALSSSGNSFVLTTRHASCEKLQELIPGSQFFHGGKKEKKSARKAAYKEMNSKDNLTIIATFGIASTGLNIPRIFNLVLYNPGKSYTRIIQSIGRGLRKAVDKDFVNIYIICTTNKWSKKHLTEIKKHCDNAGYPYTIHKVKL